MIHLLSVDEESRTYFHFWVPRGFATRLHDTVFVMVATLGYIELSCRPRILPYSILVVDNTESLA